MHFKPRRREDERQGQAKLLKRKRLAAMDSVCYKVPQ